MLTLTLAIEFRVCLLTREGVVPFSPVDIRTRLRSPAIAGEVIGKIHVPMQLPIQHCALYECHALRFR